MAEHPISDIAQRHAQRVQASRFAECAAPEAIEAALDEARIARRHLERHIDWLSHLGGIRAEQVRAGSWPPSPPTGRPEGLARFDRDGS